MGWGDRLWGGQAAAAADDGPASEPPSFVYARLRAEDDEELRAPQQPRGQRVSAPASTGGAGDAEQDGGGDGAGQVVGASSSGPLPRLPSLLADGGGAAAPVPAGGSEGGAHHWDPFAPSAASGGGAGCGASGLSAEQAALGRALAAEAAADGERRHRSTGGGAGGSGRGSDSDDDHASKSRELLIYAVPITRDKVAFLPVVPWREAPEPEKRQAAASGLGGMLRERAAAAGEEASRVWSTLQGAEEGTLRSRIARMGQRLLDSVPAEERLMRGLPSTISSVRVFHSTQQPAEALMSQMKTLTQEHGVKAVGKAAAATLMLPIAAGIDLIILPGPQVLSYFTAWQLWRNASMAVGATRATQFLTSSSSNVRVDCIQDARLDAAVAATSLSRDGVLPEEAIDQLVAALGEPALEQPLRELRRQRLRKRGCDLGDGAGRYAPLGGAGGEDEPARTPSPAPPAAAPRDGIA